MYHEHGRREVHRAARGKTFQRGLYDVIVVKWEKRLYNMSHFITYYSTLTQQGSIFSVKQSCIEKF